LVTASHDRTLAVHRMSADGEQLVEKTLIRVEVPEKINELLSFDTAAVTTPTTVPDILIGDVSPVISRFVFKS